VRVGNFLWFGWRPRARYHKVPILIITYIIHHNSYAPYIALDAINGFFLKNELRGHIEHSANPSAVLLVILFSQFLGEAEIREFGGCTFDENILSLDVAMSDVVIVEQAGSCHDVFENGEGLFFLKRSLDSDESLEVATSVRTYVSHLYMKM
jgi:hypothetical protein